MKSFVFVCLFAVGFAAPAAEPEADADALLYNTYYNYPAVYGYVPRTVYNVPVVPQVAVPEVKAEEMAAEPEKVEVKAAPVATTVYHYPTAAHLPLAYNVPHVPVTHVAPKYVAPTYKYVTPVVKPASYYANSGGAVHIAKREAEADPEAYYHGLPYTYAYRPYYAYNPYRAAYYW